MSKSVRLTLLLCRAVIFTAIIGGPGIYQFWATDSKGYLPTSHTDEVYYLQVPFSVANGLSPLAYYFEHDKPIALSTLLTSRPNAILDFAVGKIAVFLKLTPAGLGLTLDIVIAFFVYILLSFFFGRLTKSWSLRESAIMIFVVFPYVLWPPQEIEFPFPWTERIVGAYSNYFTEPAIFRGVYTQISYPILLLALIAILNALRTERYSRTMLALSGFLSGLLIYIYFFGWLATVTVTSLTILLTFLLSNSDKKERPIFSLASYLTIYFVSTLATSALGLLLTVRFQSTLNVFSDERISKYWYFSWTSLSIMVLFLFLIRIRKRYRLKAEVLSLAISCLILDLLLMNIQPILGNWISPQHFPLLYLSPIFSSLSLIIIFDLFESLAHQRILARLSQILSFGVFLFLVVQMLTNSLTTLRKKAESALSYVFPDAIPNTDYRTLLSFIEGHTPKKSTIAVNPWNYTLKPGDPIVRALPNLLTVQTGHHLFFQDWTKASYADLNETSERLRTIDWLYSEQFIIRSLCSNTEVKFPGDIFSASWTINHLGHVKLCEHLSNQAAAAISPCSELSKFRIDYILWEKQFEFKKPDWYQDFTEQVWESGGLQLLKFNQANFIYQHCQPKDI